MYKIHYGKREKTEEKDEYEHILVSPEIPSVYFKLKEKFGVDWEGTENIIICNGDTIHCKAAPIPPEKLVHELEHVKRQKIFGLSLWWDRYLNDDKFRLQEEIIAYREEYFFIKRNIEDRNAVFFTLYEMARNLSGSTYGNICNHQEAMRLIQDK